jgi:hypothetical protein
MYIFFLTPKSPMLLCKLSGQAKSRGLLHKKDQTIQMWMSPLKIAAELNYREKANSKAYFLVRMQKKDIHIP